jgi:carboxyl-terminal processing protease
VREERVLKRLGWAVCAVVVLGLAAAAPAPAWAQTSCTVLGQNTYVADTLDEFYLWYQELPTLDPAAFASPEAYLEAARFRPLDEHFSFIGLRAEQDAFYSESQFIGMGFSSSQTGPDEVRIAQVFPDSPASEAGLRRGDRLTAVGGVPIADLLATGMLGTAFGPSQIGVTVELAWRSPDGTEGHATLIKRAVTIPTVSQNYVLDVAGRRVGYLHFRNFVEPSFAALDQAFAELVAAGVSDLVLDLRYNGGGLVDVAQHLAGLIGGSITNTQVFGRMVHNDKNTFRNQVIRFENPAGSLSLPRLFVVTTGNTASSSELVINSLRPFMPVVLFGSASYGKPVGQYGFPFCEKILYPVSFKIVNARDEGDFFGGFPPDCAAPDDLEHQLGDPAEGSLASALYYIQTGACSAAAAAEARAQATRVERQRPAPRDGWELLLNAH